MVRNAFVVQEQIRVMTVSYSMVEATRTEGMHCIWARTAASNMLRGNRSTFFQQEVFLPWLHPGADNKILQFSWNFYKKSKPKKQTRKRKRVCASDKGRK